MTDDTITPENLHERLTAMLALVDRMIDLTREKHTLLKALRKSLRYARQRAEYDPDDAIRFLRATKTTLDH